MEALTAIGDRHSVRSYKHVPVAGEKINAVVQAANSAPFAGPFHISVITNEKLLKEIDAAAFKAMQNSNNDFLKQRSSLPGYRPLYGAPCLLIFSAPEANPMGALNCANAATTGAIAATALGLGSCFEISPLLGLAEDKQLAAKAGVPTANKPQCCLVFGHTEDPAKFHMERDLKDNINYCD